MGLDETKPAFQPTLASNSILWPPLPASWRQAEIRHARRVRLEEVQLVPRAAMRDCLSRPAGSFCVSCHGYSEATMGDPSDRSTLTMVPRRGRPPKERVLSDAERARRYRKKLARDGQIRVTVTIPADRRRWPELLLPSLAGSLKGT
jgi:hypothetical protein